MPGALNRGENEFSATELWNLGGKILHFVQDDMGRGFRVVFLIVILSVSEES